MKQQNERGIRRDPLDCGKLSGMRGRRLRAALVWLSVIAAAVPALIAGHVPAGVPHQVAMPGPTYLLEAAHPAPAAMPHHHVDNPSRQLEQSQPGSSHGSSGAACTLCAVCSGTAAPIPGAVSQDGLSCSSPLRIVNFKFGEVPAGMHFLSALRPHAPPHMVL
jgi:hypothetical protein